MTPVFQEIIGVSKGNPYFTICRSTAHPDLVYVYFGVALLEVIPADPRHAVFKLFIARLFNAGVNGAALTESFGVCHASMKRWGAGLASGDVELLSKAIRSPGGSHKVTDEIRRFIQLRFPTVYRHSPGHYSLRIWQEIKEVFGTGISAETLRPIFRELREQYLHQGK
jgi:hypothetical protein